MLKKLILILILCQVYILQGQGQAVAHKPAELLNIMKNSKLTYTISELYIDMKEKEFTILNSSNIYHEDSDGHMLVKKMVLSKEAKNEWDQAELAMENKSYKEARKHYRSVTEIQDDYYPAKIQIGKCFELEADFEKAEGAYKQAISKNFVDYLPHLLLAKSYLAGKNYDDAINEITYASILNRNDTGILQTMIEIYVGANLKYDDWNFNPQYKNFKAQKAGEIKVSAQKGWIGYAIGKALWEYEPGYAETQGEKPGEPSLIQEKECLMNNVAALEDDKEKDKDKDIDRRKDKDKKEDLAILQKAKEFKMLDGYAYYEILLREHPAMVYTLPNNVIKSIKNYVIMAHGGEDPQKKK